MKYFCSLKCASKIMKRQATAWEKYLKVTNLMCDLHSESRQNT